MVPVMQAPGIRPVAEITVAGLIRRVGAAIDTRFAFAPDPVDREYAERLNSLTLHDDNLSAMATDRLTYSRNIAWIDERIPSLDVPAVVLLARGDRPIPIRHGRQLGSALPGATVVEVDGGHMLPVVQPDIVAAAVSSVGHHIKPHRGSEAGLTAFAPARRPARQIRHVAVETARNQETGR